MKTKEEIKKSWKRSDKSKKLWPQHSDYKKDWTLPGSSPRKSFMSCLWANGLNGYHLGRVVGDVFIDFIFPNEHVVIKVGSLTDIEITKITNAGFLAVELPEEPDKTWLQTCQLIKGAS